MKKTISLLLCITLCVVSLPIYASATETAEDNAPSIPETGDVWDGSITQPTSLVQKDGIYYYEITKCSELAYVAQTGGDWLGYNYILGNNLILNDVLLTWSESGTLTNTETINQWIPISLFQEIFDGNGYTISGLYVNSKESFVGLFECINGGAIVKNLKITNAYVKGSYYAGGLTGRTQTAGNIENCYYSGLVISDHSGGLVGDATSATINNCKTEGIVIGAEHAGGLCSNTNYTNISNCISTSNVLGGEYSTGGLIGGATNGRVVIHNSFSSGDVRGNGPVGGFIGYGFNCTIYQCYSLGDVVSTGGVAGGFIGKFVDYSSTINNCYACGNVAAATFGGGFAGSCADDIDSCYSLGTVIGESGSGGFIGEDRRIWDEDYSATNCYFLKESDYNESLYGTSIATSEVAGEIEGKPSILLKARTTFTNWDFTNVWAISSDKNGGYPYLQWQESTLSDIAVNAVQISETTLTLAEGDYTYLTATVSPANASNQSVTWSSSNSAVVTVSTAGKVRAVAPGTANITVATADGGYTATCSITVTERKTEEYKINNITVRDDDGEPLTFIPIGDFLASVSITNLASEGDTLVFLAAYSAEGQYKGLMYVSVRDLPAGATIEVTLPIDNSAGTIAQLKAFTIASFSNIVPLGSAVSFPVQ